MDLLLHSQRPCSSGLISMHCTATRRRHIHLNNHRRHFLSIEQLKSKDAAHPLQAVLFCVGRNFQTGEFREACESAQFQCRNGCNASLVNRCGSHSSKQSSCFKGESRTDPPHMSTSSVQETERTLEPSCFTQTPKSRGPASCFNLSIHAALA